MAMMTTALQQKQNIIYPTQDKWAKLNFAVENIFFVLKSFIFALKSFREKQLQIKQRPPSLFLKLKKNKATFQQNAPQIAKMFLIPDVTRNEITMYK